jgi:hypothetical protein
MLYILYLRLTKSKNKSRSVYLFAYFAEVLAIIIIVAVTSATVKPNKAEHYAKGLVNVAYIHGTEITLHLQAHRDYLPCEGATRIVRLVTYWDTEQKRIKDVRFALESTIVDDNNLDVDEWAVYHIYAPLPGDLSNWFVFSDLHYNCPWWYDLVPNVVIRNLQNANIHSPPLSLTTNSPLARLSR